MKYLNGLIERVRAATGPDRELEGDIIATLGFHSWAGRMSYRDADGMRSWDFGSSEITASIDAIVALIERVLPGWRICFDVVDGLAEDVYLLGPQYQSNGTRPDQESEPFAGMPTALALCLAFLTALKTQEQPQ